MKGVIREARWYGVILSPLLPLVGFVLFWIFYPLQFDTQRQEVSFWIPPNAEIRSASEVTPGTFKIHVSPEEMQQTTRSDQRVLLVYNTINVGDTAAPTVQYWRTGEGSTFYFATKFLEHSPEQTRFFFEPVFIDWSVIYDKDRNLFVFFRSKTGTGAAGITTIALIVLGMVGVAVAGEKMRRIALLSAKYQ
ncbi:MAG: hypothetical protein Q7S63_02555 [bacterium]|nr:hypothetical protein [bacterium]